MLPISVNCILLSVRPHKDNIRYICGGGTGEGSICKPIQAISFLILPVLPVHKGISILGIRGENFKKVGCFTSSMYWFS